MDCARGETVDDIKEGLRRRKVLLWGCECGGPKFVEVLGNIRGVAGVGGGLCGWGINAADLKT